MKTAKILLNIAKDDLKSSELLYKNKLYPQALFYYQQSVEKANKAFAIALNIIKPEDIYKKVGHNSTEIYNILLKEQKQNILDLVELSKWKPETLKVESFKQAVSSRTQQYIDKGLEFIEIIYTKKKKIAILSEEDILKIIDMISSFTFVRLRPTKKMMLFISDHFEIFKREMISLNTILESQQLDEEIAILRVMSLKNIFCKKYGIKRNMKLFCKLADIQQRILYAYNVLFWCSIVTLPHSVDTRYPNIKENKNPYKRYNKNNPLIKYLPVFIQFQQKTLRILVNLLE